MRYCLKLTQAIVASAFACLALTAGPLAFSQAPSTAPRLDTTGQPIVPNLPLYDSFLRNLGQEDDSIQKARREATRRAMADGISQRPSASARMRSR
jgi:hypothetical protein